MRIQIAEYDSPYDDEAEFVSYMLLIIGFVFIQILEKFNLANNWAPLHMIIFLLQSWSVYEWAACYLVDILV